MAYASLAQIAALNMVRATYNNSTKPTASQVEVLRKSIEAEIDSCIRSAGYQLPVPTTATSALDLLLGMECAGVNWRIELSAQVTDPNRRDEYQEMYESGLKMIKHKELDIPKDDSTSGPRSPFDELASQMFFWATQTL